MMLADQAAKYSTILKEAVFTCESMTITIRQKIYINIVLPDPWLLRLWPIYYTQMYIL